jgi:hypothetical protein
MANKTPYLAFQRINDLEKDTPKYSQVENRAICWLHVAIFKILNNLRFSLAPVYAMMENSLTISYYSETEPSIFC